MREVSRAELHPCWQVVPATGSCFSLIDLDRRPGTSNRTNSTDVFVNISHLARPLVTLHTVVFHGPKTFDSQHSAAAQLCCQVGGRQMRQGY